MRYLCSCGKEGEISFTSLKRGNRCYYCGLEKMKAKQKLDIEEVKKIFIDNNCYMVDDKYINAVNPIKYKCECGDISYISLSHFKRGHRCKKCGYAKISGENSPFWNPNITDEHRDAKRYKNKTEYKE